MAEENNDANTGAEDTTGADSSSDAVELEPIVDDDGLVSTIEYQTVEKKEEATDDTKGEDNSDGAENNTPEDPKSTPKGFNDPEHPDHERFKELIESNKDLKKQIEDLKNSKESQPEKPAAATQQEQDFINYMAMDNDRIMEDFSDDPKGVMQNFFRQYDYEKSLDRKNREAAEKEQAKALSLKEQADNTRNEFFKDKEDGQAMLDDGRIQAFIDENPGHNEISAYHALAGEANTKAQIDAAVKKAEERIYKELKAKGNAKSTATPTGGTLINSDNSPEMKDPNKFGGTESVLLKRFLARQSA